MPAHATRPHAMHGHAALHPVSFSADAHPLRQPRPQLPHHLINAGHAAAACRGGRLRHQGAAWAAWWLGAAMGGGCPRNESRACCCEVLPHTLLRVHATTAAWYGMAWHGASRASELTHALSWAWAFCSIVPPHHDASRSKLLSHIAIVLATMCVCSWTSGRQSLWLTLERAPPRRVTSMLQSTLQPRCR